MVPFLHLENTKSPMVCNLFGCLSVDFTIFSRGFCALFGSRSVCDGDGQGSIALWISGGGVDRRGRGRYDGSGHLKFCGRFRCPHRLYHAGASAVKGKIVENLWNFLLTPRQRFGTMKGATQFFSRRQPSAFIVPEPRPAVKPSSYPQGYGTLRPPNNLHLFQPFGYGTESYP